MELIFSHILNMSLTASIVIGLVLLIRLLLRRAPKAYAYALWAVVLFRLLCPISLPSPVSILEPLHPEVSEGALVTSFVTYVPIRISQPEPMESLPEPAEPASPPAEKPGSPLAVIPWIYLLVTVGMLGYGVASYLILRRKLSEAIRYRRNVYLADRIQIPFILGIFRPRIYLPSSLDGLELRCILAHEWYHIRRGDHIWKVLAYIALSIHWFNPLVWLSFVLAGRDMEMSCDEAVIRRLGPAVRADYASSLLRLSIGRRPVGIPPLSFEAGNPKARIRNMARWRKPALGLTILCTALCATVLLACGANPSKAPEETAPVQASANQPDIPATQPVNIPPELTLQEEFQNPAGDITYHLDREIRLDSQPLPVVEVQPRFLTEEDAQRVARLFFGDTVGYESDYIFAEPKLSRQEIQDAIDRWTPYLDQANIAALNGQEDEMTAQVVTAFLEEYRAMYETAPETVERTPCLWQFFEKGHYYGDFYGSNMIKAEYTFQGVPYTYTVESQNNSAYRGNRIEIWIREGGPLSMDSAIYTARLCRTDRPAQAQLEAVQAKAQSILDQMELGSWQVRSCTLQEYSPGPDADPRYIPAYSIKILACPVIRGIPVIAQDRAMGAGDDSYTESPSASFEFSANGDLIHFELYDPIVEVSTTDAITPLSGAELTAAIRQCLMTAPAKPQFRYGPGTQSAEDFRYEVYLENAAYEYICVAGPQSGAFSYVPCYVLYCRQEQWGIESGQQYDLGQPAILYAALRADGGGVYY